MGTSHPDARPSVGADEYDAIVLVGFGGPERLEDVLPFLENVTRGRNIARERLLEVAEHYHHFGGVSPINAQVRALIAALRLELDRHEISLPIYWGNRNWHPMLADTLAEMTARGVKRALAIVLAAYSSYSSCRQYREDIGRAQAAAGLDAPEVDKVRVFYNHPEFIAANAERVGEKLESFTTLGDGPVHLAFTAHSIPQSMAQTCDYEQQLRETCRLVAESAGIGAERWALVYQSRSGRPEDPWLGPDILDHLKNLKERGVKQVVIHPVGFLSDHLEVLYDLDVEARVLGDELGLQMVRSRTVGAHPRFVTMLRMLVEERIGAGPQQARAAVGIHGPSHDVCPESCCLPPPRPASRRAEQTRTD
jgi:protoporphyrin/coproporphyrin ferrochelatase